MQDIMRDVGQHHLRKEDLEKFVKARTEGTLVKPEDSGYVIAALSVKASKELSGKFVTWNSDECREYRRPWKQENQKAVNL